MSEHESQAAEARRTSPVSRDAPLPASLSVREARDAYLAENGFDTETYTAETVTLMAFGRTWSFPNRPNRQWAIPLHDLHHVATGFGSDLVGEGEIGAWELAAGCRTPVVYALNAAALLVGLFLAPRRMLEAYRAGLRSLALYRQPIAYDALLALDLGTLRARLRLPEDGLATHPRRLHEAAPAQPAATREASASH